MGTIQIGVCDKIENIDYILAVNEISLAASVERKEEPFFQRYGFSAVKTLTCRWCNKPFLRTA